MFMPPHQILCNHRNLLVDYSIVHGFDPALTIQAESDWTLEKMSVLTELLAAHPEAATNQQKFVEMLDEYNLTDWHWSWNRKALHCLGGGYEWFYLIADNKVQAICIIFHPKKSPLQNDDIFYVDYIAVAYRNRKRPNYKRQYERLATILLSHCIKHSVEQLRYRHGFFLHSLPSAEPYYSSKGLTNLGKDPSKENLTVFEASENCSLQLFEEYANA